MKTKEIREMTEAEAQAKLRDLRQELFNLRLQQRLSKGLSIIFNFMQSKMVDQTTWLNDTDLQPERRISPFFRPTRAVTAITYELPIGRGKSIDLRSRWLNLLIGGWNVTTTFRPMPGAIAKARLV